MREFKLNERVSLVGDPATVLGTGTVHENGQPLPWLLLQWDDGETVKLRGDELDRVEPGDRASLIAAGHCICGPTMRPGAYDPECPIDGEV